MSTRPLCLQRPHAGPISRHPFLISVFYPPISKPQIKDTLYHLWRDPCSHPKSPQSSQLCGGESRNGHVGGGTTDYPSESPLTPHGPQLKYVLYGDGPICGKFSTSLPCHPFHFLLATEGRDPSSPRAPVMSSSPLMTATLDSRRRGVVSLSLRWKAIYRRRRVASKASENTRRNDESDYQTTIPSRLSNYEGPLCTSAAPRGRTHRSCLLLDECPYWRRRRLHP
jgi:hypothetical protein